MRIRLIVVPDYSVTQDIDQHLRNKQKFEDEFPFDIDHLDRTVETCEDYPTEKAAIARLYMQAFVEGFEAYNSMSYVYTE